MKVVVATGALLLSIAAVSETRQNPGAVNNDAFQFLQAHFRLGANDFTALDRGQSVTRTLETVDSREVATLGVVKLEAPVRFYVDQLRDIVSFKGAGAAVLQIGVFSTPARMDDVDGLSLDERDLESLRRCRPGECKVQLSGDAIERVRQEIPWGRPEARAVAERTIRYILVELVNRYRNAGDAGLMTYMDSDRPVSLSSEFHSMVASPPALLERFPELHRHVFDFPRTSASVEDIVYWSKEKMGPAVIISVTHLAITSLDGPQRGTLAAASKQLYGSHYFDSSLGITVVLDASVGNEPASILVYVNRSRLDALGGFWGGLKRRIVRSRTRSAMESSLVEARDLVEHRFRTATASTN